MQQKDKYNKQYDSYYSHNNKEIVLYQIYKIGLDVFGRIICQCSMYRRVRYDISKSCHDRIQLYVSFAQINAIIHINTSIDRCEMKLFTREFDSTISKKHLESLITG